jgi:DNA-3-methyladenine glycosylase II
MQALSPELHRQFVVTARRISPILSREISRHGPIGYQRRRTRDLGTHLARVVVGQQLSTTAARAIWTRVAAAAERRAVLDICTDEHFQALRGCGLSNNKVKALFALRDARDAGTLNARALAKLPHAERASALTGLWGIGAWTADMVSMFFFREPDVWPLGDLAVRKTFERYVSGHARFDVHSGAALFAPYRSFLALYMWRIANNGPDE